MTTEAQGRKATSACNGVTTVFSVPFPFIANSDLKVYLLDAVDDANEDGELLSEGSDYTISGDSRAGTAQITTVGAQPNGKFIRRWRETSRAQSADYIANDGFAAEGHETQLDRLSLVDEEQDDDTATADARLTDLEDRAITVPEGEEGFDIPAAVDRASKWLGFDEDGNVVAGDPAADAASPSFTFAVNTLSPGSEATVTPSGTYPNILLTFGIPRGNAGASGALGDGSYGGIAVSGTGSVLEVVASHITLARMADLPANRIIGNNTGATATPIALTVSQVKTMLSISNVDNTSDANKPVSTAQAAADDALLNVPQNAKTAAYQLVLTDRGKHISITTGGVTIPANGTVAFPVGSTISIYNDSGSSQTIGITTDTLRLAGTSTTGSRTLAQRGLCTLLKVKTTEWVITGAGLS